MSKPTWGDAPDWANYLAMDSSGQWNWFENQPYFELGEWWTDGDSEAANEKPNPRYSMEYRP